MRLVFVFSPPSNVIFHWRNSRNIFLIPTCYWPPPGKKTHHWRHENICLCSLKLHPGVISAYRFALQQPEVIFLPQQGFRTGLRRQRRSSATAAESTSGIFRFSTSWRTSSWATSPLWTRPSDRSPWRSGRTRQSLSWVSYLVWFGGERES